MKKIKAKCCKCESEILTLPVNAKITLCKTCLKMVSDSHDITHDLVTAIEKELYGKKK